MKRTILNSLLEAREAKRPAALLTDLKTGIQFVVFGDDRSNPNGFDVELLESIQKCIKDDKSRSVTTEADGEYFVHIHNPPLRLFVVGAVHITQALFPMAMLAGFDVTVIDPRGSFATDDRFPGVTLSNEWPDVALKTAKLDARTAIVTLTHDPKIDDPALDVALESNVFYIGSLGSRRTHAKRVTRLDEEGYSEDKIARIQAPIGLDIGSILPAEIAVSILAEMIQALRRN
ncbi:MAG: XdhC family protein [Rhodospirillales bacterium]